MKKEKEVIVKEDPNLDGNDGSFTMPAQTKVRRGWWNKKSRASRVGFIISLVVLAISIGLFFVWVYAREIFDQNTADTLLGYYLDEYGQKVYYHDGWQIIGKHAIYAASNIGIAIFVIAFTIIIFFLLTLIIYLLTNNKSRKSQTIGSLLRSLVKYICVLVDFGIILALFGVDVAGIIAGVGVLTLVIGLGCQTLIQDIISGLFIVFDDYFAVGDIVIIDGFRGTVTEVGLKTTKVQDAGGNIKSISNSHITTVANLSRYDTMITVSIGAAYEEDVVRVEGIMAGAMEEIGKKIPNITKGPFYKGIDKITDSSINYMVLCYAKEADRFQVTRDLNKELLLLFHEHDIIIPYHQVSINQANDKNRKKANDKEIADSKKATKELREVAKEPEDKKKKTLKHKLDTAIKAAAKDSKL